ncbi:MAG: hypothetical protein ABIZ50_02190 [Solirubrobacterales bacterium]
MVLRGEAEAIEKRLTGGHPNSLGNTIEVVDVVLADSQLVAPLLETYASEDEVVRLRVSSAVKRVTEAHPEWMLPHLGRLQGGIAQIDQASTKWTQPKLYLALWDLMDEGQRERSKEIVMGNLEADDDWIVQNNSIEALTIWAGDDQDLREWLKPRLELRSQDSRKSVAKRASKALKVLTATDGGGARPDAELPSFR